MTSLGLSIYVYVSSVLLSRRFQLNQALPVTDQGGIIAARRLTALLPSAVWTTSAESRSQNRTGQQVIPPRAQPQAIADIEQAVCTQGSVIRIDAIIGICEMNLHHSQDISKDEIILIIIR